MDFPGENTGVGYHFLFPEDLPDPGIKPESPALQVDALPSTPPGKTSLCCYCQVTSVSDSVRPHPWDSPGKNTGVGCHVLLQCMKVKSKSEVAQPCPTLVTPWIIAHQAPPSMGFSRQEYWSGVPSPSLRPLSTYLRKVPIRMCSHTTHAKHQFLFIHFPDVYPIYFSFIKWVQAYLRVA